MRIYSYFIFLVFISACRSEKFSSIYNSDFPSKITTLSACRVTEYNFSENEKSALRNTLKKSLINGTEKLNLKLSSKKADFIILRNECVLTEKCADKTQASALSMHQVLELKNSLSGETTQFLSDTLIPSNKAFAGKEKYSTDVNGILNALTLQNLLKAKEFLRKK